MSNSNFSTLPRRSFLFACLLVGMGLSIFSSPASAQTGSQTFKLRYAWGYSSLAQVRGGIDRYTQITLRLNQNGSADLMSGTTGALVTPNFATWTLVGNQITFVFSSSVYTGTLQTDGSYTGSMVNVNNWYGVWKGSFYP